MAVIKAMTNHIPMAIGERKNSIQACAAHDQLSRDLNSRYTGCSLPFRSSHASSWHESFKWILLISPHASQVNTMRLAMLWLSTSITSSAPHLAQITPILCIAN
jgi:hypothetical protein